MYVMTLMVRGLAIRATTFAQRRDAAPARGQIIAALVSQEPLGLSQFDLGDAPGDDLMDDVAFGLNGFQFRDLDVKRRRAVRDAAALF